MTTVTFFAEPVYDKLFPAVSPNTQRVAMYIGVTFQFALGPELINLEELSCLQRQPSFTVAFTILLGRLLPRAFGVI